MDIDPRLLGRGNVLTQSVWESELFMRSMSMAICVALALLGDRNATQADVS
jgi:hypothetical protein